MDPITKIPTSLFLKCPVPIDPRWQDKDSFPTEAMDDLEGFTLCVARRNCVPPSAVAMSMLTAASALTAWWIKVDTAGWGIQPGNLYTLFSALPGANKGGIFDWVVDPVVEMLRAKSKELKLAQEHVDWQIEQLRKELDDTEDEAVAKELNHRIAELKLKKGKTRMCSSTATSAGIGSSLERNGAAYASFAAEAGPAVQVLLGQHTAGNADAKMFLAGFKGEAADNDVGIGGNELDIPRFIMSVLWFFTPHGVEQMIKNPEIVANGAISRATLIQYKRMDLPEPVDPLPDEDRELPRWLSYLKALEPYRYTFEEPDTDEDGQPIMHPAPKNAYYPDGQRKPRDPHIVKLTPEARELFRSEQKRLAGIINEQSDLMVSFCVRFAVPITHIALQLHLMRHKRELADKTIAWTEIDACTMADAIKINAWLVNHQLRNLDLIENSAIAGEAQRITGIVARWKHSKGDPCPLRELTRSYGSGPKAIEAAEACERAGYLSLWLRKVPRQRDLQVCIAIAKSEQEQRLQSMSESETPIVWRRPVAAKLP